MMADAAPRPTVYSLLLELRRENSAAHEDIKRTLSAINGRVRAVEQENAERRGRETAVRGIIASVGGAIGAAIATAVSILRE